MCPIAWDDGPRAGKSSPPVPILNVKHRSFVRFAGELMGVFVHWAYQRTLPCLSHRCKHCADGLPSRWAGYVAALQWCAATETRTGSWVPVVLHIPAGNRDQLLEAAPLFGTVWAIERVPAKLGNILKFTVSEQPKQPLVAPEIDVKAVLMKLWRYGDQQANAWAEQLPDATPPAAEPEHPTTLPFPRRKRGGA